jgi:hypothetical protein
MCSRMCLQSNTRFYTRLLRLHYNGARKQGFEGRARAGGESTQRHQGAKTRGVLGFLSPRAFGSWRLGAEARTENRRRSGGGASAPVVGHTETPGLGEGFNAKTRRRKDARGHRREDRSRVSCPEMGVRHDKGTQANRLMAGTRLPASCPIPARRSANARSRDS